MAKKSNNSLIIVGVVIALILVGVFVYTRQTDEPVQNQPTTSSNCKTFDGKEYCSNSYIGLKEDEAVKKAGNDGFEVRVVQKDNKNIAVTGIPSDQRDFRDFRGLSPNRE